MWVPYVATHADPSRGYRRGEEDPPGNPPGGSPRGIPLGKPQGDTPITLIIILVDNNRAAPRAETWSSWEIILFPSDHF